MTMMTDIPIFSPDEAAGVAARLLALRDKWLVRNLGFATFGVATYLDVMCSQTPEESYYERVPQWNAFLRDEFGDVLETVRTAVSRYYGMPARFEAAVALPGFHIFENEGVCVHDRPSQHFDLQHRYLRWPFGPVTDEVMSFTLPLKLPRMGGALEVWDVTEADMKRYSAMGRNITMETLGRTKPSVRHGYTPGVAAVQLRPVMHRIAPIKATYDGDQRITMQGHGVRDGDGWVLYW